MQLKQFIFYSLFQWYKNAAIDEADAVNANTQEHGSSYSQEQNEIQQGIKP